ncbi:response regulator [Sneathiella sp.]|uniref:response regulator n=1 Tax=Sneathiella sp. TaxID=1964365 RepID=UPI00260A73E2|nr:response regulator [Sneathiella sp.]MDF2366563.1 response regulator [Sneathiella sp.]
MHDPRFKAASALLFDSEPSMRQNTRSALLNLGLGDVIACSDLYQFTALASRGEFDLILAEASIAGTGVHQLIQEIRSHKIGPDPFINVILFLWNSEPNMVGEIMNAGADDVITRPMSRTQIFSRLKRLVMARKPFVVTADYFGPDRRNALRSRSGVPTMIVPNSLKAKVENRPELAATPEAIKSAMKVVKERKISTYSEQLMRLSSAVILLSGSADSFGDRRDVISVMQQRNNALIDSVEGTEHVHVISLCQALADLLSSIVHANSSLKDKDRELLSQIPYAIHKACADLHQTAGLAFDIREVSARVSDTRKQSRYGYFRAEGKISHTLR